MIKSLIKNFFLFSKLAKVPVNNTKAPSKIASQSSNQLILVSFKNLSLKQFALTAKQANLSKNHDQIYWHSVGQQFLQRLQATTNPQKIRSYSVLLYHLSKTKANISIGNVEVPFSMMLPFSSPQSFASIVSSLSRMGQFNNEFSMIVRKNYESKKHELGIREKVTINYSMVRNGDTMDTELLECFVQMNLKQIVTTLRMADQCNKISQDVLKDACKHIVLKRKELNSLDFSHILEILGKHNYLPKQVEESLSYAYKFIKRNMDSGAIEKVWKYFPHLVNNNLLTIDLTQQIILTLRILYKKGELSEQFVRQIRRDLNKINNIQIRLRCELK